MRTADGPAAAVLRVLIRWCSRSSSAASCSWRSARIRSTITASCCSAACCAGAALQETLTRMAPLLLIAAGLIVAFRAGIWNLGGDGQFLLAAVTAAALAPALAGVLPRGRRSSVCMVGGRAGRRALVVAAGDAQGALRRQRDHHHTDDELSRRQPRECPDQARAARSGHHRAADPEPAGG